MACGCKELTEAWGRGPVLPFDVTGAMLTLRPKAALRGMLLLFLALIVLFDTVSASSPQRSPRRGGVGAPQLFLNSTVVSRPGAPLGFSWRGADGAESGGPGVYLCPQDAACAQDNSTSAWAGLFAAGASFEQVGPHVRKQGKGTDT